MGALTERLDARRTTVWIDGLAYAAALFSNDVVPWLDAAEFAALQRRAQGLLGSDIAQLAIAPACAAWVRSHEHLQHAMRAKKRPGFALRTLLADDALRAHLLDLAAGIGSADVPVALVLPSPRAWVAVSHAQVFAGEDIDVDDDAADDAAVYVADFLRSFGAGGVQVALLEESMGFVPATAANLEPYQSVLNVASSYGWDIGLQSRGRIDPLAMPGLDFTIAPAAASLRQGIEMDVCFWDGDDDVPEVPLRYTKVPRQARPETVLQRIARLHQ